MARTVMQHVLARLRSIGLTSPLLHLVGSPNMATQATRALMHHTPEK
jgi:hypothetical protein